MPRYVVAVSAVLIGAAISGCGQKSSANPVNECVQNGIAYYKEIGSYPTLTSPQYAGRSAEDVAREKCSRSSLAFPSTK